MENTTSQEANENENEFQKNDLLERNNENQENDQEELEMSINKADEHEEIKTKLTKLPIGRVRTIIKTDTEINLINQEAVFLVTKATVIKQINYFYHFINNSI